MRRIKKAIVGRILPKMLGFILKNAPWDERTWVGNRRIYKVTGPTNLMRVTITVEDLNEPGGCSREELVKMLRLLRSEEKRQGWKAPEPEPEEL